MIKPPELPINDEARHNTHIANQGVRLYQLTSRVATSKMEWGN